MYTRHALINTLSVTYIMYIRNFLYFASFADLLATSKFQLCKKRNVLLLSISR